MLFERNLISRKELDDLLRADARFRFENASRAISAPVQPPPPPSPPSPSSSNGGSDRNSDRGGREVGCIGVSGVLRASGMDREDPRYRMAKRAASKRREVEERRERDRQQVKESQTREVLSSYHRLSNCSSICLTHRTRRSGVESFQRIGRRLGIRVEWKFCVREESLRIIARKFGNFSSAIP